MCTPPCPSPFWCGTLACRVSTSSGAMAYGTPRNGTYALARAFLDVVVVVFHAGTTYLTRSARTSSYPVCFLLHVQILSNSAMVSGIAISFTTPRFVSACFGSHVLEVRWRLPRLGSSRRGRRRCPCRRAHFFAVQDGPAHALSAGPLGTSKKFQCILDAWSVHSLGSSRNTGLRLLRLSSRKKNVKLDVARTRPGRCSRCYLADGMKSQSWAKFFTSGSSEHDQIGSSTTVLEEHA